MPKKTGSISDHTKFIKSTSTNLGFNYCGIAKAERLTDDEKRLSSWLNKGFHGEMNYMENHFDLRIDPRLLVPGAKSVITLMMNYYPVAPQDEDAPRVAKYAYGKDYHEIIREKLNEFLRLIKVNIGDVTGRGFVDSAPVLERSWAQKSGLGWIGKNGNLISRKSGSFFFIATLITDLALEFDPPNLRDYCGSCRRCIDACPTDAILDNKVIDASKCISYFTIELKDQLIPDAMKGKFEDWLFGCDTCQDVCPWNRFSTTSSEPAFEPITEILHFSTKDWEELTEESFKKIFRNSPLRRTKFSGIKRNLQFIKS